MVNWQTYVFRHGKSRCVLPEYYKQTDYDGKFSHSQLEQVVINEVNAEFILFPNPSTAGQPVELIINSTIDEKILILVREINGREILSKEIMVQKGIAETVSIDSNQNLTAGMYLISVISDNSVYNQKLIVK